MKQILVILLLLGSAQLGLAQEKTHRPVSWELALSPGLVLADVDATPATLGVDTRIQQRFGRNFAWMVSLGYSHFFGYEGAYFSLKAGMKAYLQPRFYLAAEVGIAELGESDGELLLISPSIGMLAGKRWDLALKYESVGGFDYMQDKQLAFRVGFKLSR